MGFYTADGAVVNAAPPSPYIQGGATISGAASVAPDATRIIPTPEATSSGVAAATALLSVILQTGVAASAAASPELFFSPTKIHAGGFAVASDATVSSFITRLTDGFSVVTGQAQVIAIPADKIGDSDTGGQAAIVPDATRRVRPRVAAAADAVVTAECIHTRFGDAVTSGQAFVYTEVGINGVFEAYSETLALGFATADAVNFKSQVGVGADILGEAMPAAAAIRTQRPDSDPASDASVVIADAFLTTGVGILYRADAAVTVDPDLVVRVVQPVSNPTGTADLGTPRAKQQFAGGVSFSASGAIAVDDTVIADGVAHIDAPATVTAELTIVKVPTTDATVTAAVTADPDTIFAGVATNAGAATINVEAVRVVVPEDLTAPAVAAVSPTAVRVLVPDDLVTTGTGTITGNASKVRIAQPEPMIGAVTSYILGGILNFAEANVDAVALIDADSIANVDSVDPPCRYFYRPPTVAVFTRPEQEFEYIRRCA